MRPNLNQLLMSRFDSPLVLYLVPSGVTLYFMAFGVTAFLLVRRSGDSGLSRRHAALGALLAALGGLAGARVYYLLHHYTYVRQHMEVIHQCGGGLASWGAYFGGLSVFVAYLRIRRQDTLRYLDVLASVLGLGPFIIRWSCFLNGCCYGTPTRSPWGVSYPSDSFAYRSHLTGGLLDGGSAQSLPVHPVQVYLSILGLTIFLLASLFWKRYSHYRGATFVFYWSIYVVSRFLIEFLRGDVPRYTALELTLSQIVIVMVLFAVMVGTRLLFRSERPGPPRTSI